MVSNPCEPPPDCPVAAHNVRLPKEKIMNPNPPDQTAPLSRTEHEAVAPMSPLATQRPASEAVPVPDPRNDETAPTVAGQPIVKEVAAVADDSTAPVDGTAEGSHCWLAQQC